MEASATTVWIADNTVGILYNNTLHDGSDYPYMLYHNNNPSMNMDFEPDAIEGQQSSTAWGLAIYKL